MTARVFQAIRDHARLSGHAICLRSGDRVIDYQHLAAFLAESAAVLEKGPRVVGIAGPDPLEAALADLALTFSGLVPVHLPPFFSPEQKAHIVQAAGIEAVIGDPESTLPAITLSRPETCAPIDHLQDPVDGAQRIIFTSGSSGQPKGVHLAERQVAAALAGLQTAILPESTDIHLSLLPMAQLLEQVAGLYLPLLVGAEVRFCPEALAALFGGPIAPVLRTLAQTRPTTTIVVPALLARLVAGLQNAGTAAPDSLRFVAVGGAATAPALLSAASAMGLPVYEGYGLSECCSVVSLNRPGAMRQGSVGRPLDNVTVRIDAGEIVVSGPTVMDGYLGQPPVTGDWRTGDLGRIEDGHLIFEGRKDWLIVTPEGRNINPEWVEAQLGADPRIPAAGLHLAADGALELFAAIAAPVGADRVADLLAGLPAFARPARVIFVQASMEGLLKPGGGLDRTRLARLSTSHPSTPLNYDIKERVA
jgi:long-subunit acyl-CoA synthetase (AMP-forming)